MSTKFQKILGVLLLFALTYTVMVLVIQSVGLNNAHQWIKQAGIGAPLLFVIICALSLIIAPLSGSAIFVMGGALFGREVGFGLSFFGSTIGCSINFWLSRKFGRRIVERLMGKSDLAQLDRLIDRLAQHHSIVYIGLLMSLSQDLVSYAVGLTKVSYVNFLIALLVSGVFIVGAYTYLGTGLLEWVLKR